MTPTATVEMEVGGRTISRPARRRPGGCGVPDHCRAHGTKSKLEAYLVKGITGGTDALGEVTVKVEEAGKRVAGHGADTDIIVASAKAYVNALTSWSTGNRDGRRAVNPVFMDRRDQIDEKLLKAPLRGLFV